LSDFPEPRFDDEIEREQIAEEQRRREHERKRAEFRAKFPKVTAFADDLRAQGFEPKVIWAYEDGNAVGPVPDDVRHGGPVQAPVVPTPPAAEKAQPTAYERAVAALQQQKSTKRTKR
jgi:hypothetical protein